MNKKKKKKIILSSIVVTAYILSFIFAWAIKELFLDLNILDEFDPLQTYMTLDYSFAFVLSTPFYFILIIFFRHHKDLMWFSIVSMVSGLGFVLFNSFSFTMDPDSNLMRLFAGVSYFGAIINLLLSFKIILQEKYLVFINRSFLLFAVINYGFFSFYTPHIKRFLAVFVGPYPHFLRNTFLFYDYFYLFLQISMVIVQLMIISFFIDNRRHKRKKIY